jgi:hypothetical protein
VVDNSGLSSSGNVYLASRNTGLVYGFSPTGVPLGGSFPIDPAVTPGAPNGFPKELCGLAVDSAGDIWVANSASKRILEYSPAGVSLPGAVDTTAHGSPCSLAFDSNDDLYASLSDGLWKYTASSGYTAATQVTPSTPNAIAVDPSTHRVYAAYESWVDEYDVSGALIDEFATDISPANFLGVAVDSTSHDLYLAARDNSQIHVLGLGVILPEVQLGVASAVTNASATLHGAVGTQGMALTACHFEYVTEAAFRTGGFSSLSSGGSAPCSPASGSIPADFESHPVTATVAVTASTPYRFRLAAENAEGSAVTDGGSFETAGPPDAETTGSPVRTATTVRLEGRANPHLAATTYHFEYGDEGPCGASPCASTEPRPVGSGSLIELVSQQVSGLRPGATYHYRLVAENAFPGSPVFGEDMTVGTRASDVPLAHGHFPGPPGSDRSWEQVNLPETGGNPVIGALDISDDGDRVAYQLPGGTPITDSGSGFNLLFAERTATGWQSRSILPPRAEVEGPNWFAPYATGDLSTLATLNFSTTTGQSAIWHLAPDAAPSKLQTASKSTYNEFYAASDDGSTVVEALRGSVDPTHPVPAEAPNLYDVGSGTPHLVSLLPGDVVPCGIRGGTPLGGLPNNYASRTSHWISADGSLVFFPSSENGSCGSRSSFSGPAQLFVRDIPAGTTRRVSTPPLSGPACEAAFIKSTPEAAFFWTQSRLAAEDTAPAACSGASDGDVYRFGLAGGGLECLTCVVPGLDADVIPGSGAGGASKNIAVAEDGSRVYFQSPNRLLAGAATPGTYRLDVASGALRYIGSLGSGSVGDATESGNAMTPDGATIVFRSSDPSLNPLGGTSNGGTSQYYLYDDHVRSLSCVSCPADGSAPRAAVRSSLKTSNDQVGPNITPLDDRGDFAFVTPTPLIGADQNTAGAGQGPYAGADVYEWREGRVLLVSDGLTNWPAEEIAPTVSGVDPDGRDIYFTAAAQLTPDALDGNQRLYDARIGGGFDFPQPPQPCPLEVCQGTPKGAPSDPLPGTTGFSGVPDPQPTFAHKKKQRRHKKKHHSRHKKKSSKKKSHPEKPRHRRANHDRRAAR